MAPSLPTPLSTLEAHLQTLIPNPTNPTPTNGIPGAVLLATTRSSGPTTTATTATYSHSLGTTSLLPHESRPLTPSSLFWIASCTKLLTSLAALHIVHRGLWSLDRPVTDLIPELRECRVLKGWRAEDKSPIFEDEDPAHGKVAADTITLAHLLTHTSGLAYDFLSPDILKYQAWRRGQQEQKVASSRPPGSRVKKGGILDLYLTPLLSRPGTTWMYGPSIDFAGLLVERLSGQRLGEYVQEHVLRPVGVGVAGEEQKGEVIWRAEELREGDGWTEEKKRERWVYLSMRSPDGTGGMVGVPGGIGSGPTDAAVDDLGGGGIRASPRAYVKVLESLVRGDGRVLPKGVLEQWAFAPCLLDEREGRGKGLGGHLGREMARVFGTLDGGKMLTGGFSLPEEGSGGMWDGGEYEFNHSLVGCLTRKRGSKDAWALHWGGLPNLFWFVDPQEEVAGLLSMQLLPPADPVCIDVAMRFRDAVTKQLGKSAREAAEREEKKARAKI